MCPPTTCPPRNWRTDRNAERDFKLQQAGPGGIGCRRDEKAETERAPARKRAEAERVMAEKKLAREDERALEGNAFLLLAHEVSLNELDLKIKMLTEMNSKTWCLALRCWMILISGSQPMR